MRLAFSVVLIIFFQIGNAQPRKLKDIPTQEINLSKVFQCYKVDTFKTTIPAFSLSQFITLKQYKTFLDSVKVDTTFSYSKSLLIDSNICSANCYKEYTSNKANEKHSVVGVSWESAMEFCKYYTLKDNEYGEINFVYRLPTINEWGAAYAYLGKKSDLNKDYSDWTLNTFEEAAYIFSNPFSQYEHDLNMAYHYDPYEQLPPVLKRKRRIGNSFDYQLKTIEESFKNKYAYSYNGYKDIGFRMVKIQKDDMFFNATLKYWGIE